MKLRVENWGESALAERLGVIRYPAVFVNDSIFASPRDLGFYGEAKSGKYTPFREPESQARFKLDLVRAVDRSLAGLALETASTSGDAEIAVAPKLLGEDLRGKPLLVEFWATWCAPCKKTLPFLAELKRKRGDALEIRTFALESEEKDARDMAASLAPGIPVAMATPEIARAFGDILAVPTLFLFDGEGKTVKVFYGAPDGLHEEVEKALSSVH